MADQNDVNRILGGFNTLNQGMGYFQAKKDSEDARNRPLSGYEKWLGKVLSGELAPEEAAILAQHEQRQAAPGQEPAPISVQQMGPTPQQPQRPAPQQPFGYQPQMGQSFGLGGQGNAPMHPQGQPEAYPPMPTQAPPQPRMSQVSQGLSAPQEPQAPAPQMSAPQPGLSGPRAPETAGDFGALMGAAPFLRASKAGGLSIEDRVLLKRMDEERLLKGINARGGISTTLQDDKQTATTERDEIKAKADAKRVADQIAKDIQVALIRAKASIANTASRGSVSQQIALLNAELKNLGQQRNMVTNTLRATPYIAGDEPSQAIVDGNMQDIAATERKIQEKIKRLEAMGSSPTSSTSTTITAPALSVSDLLKKTRGQ